MPRAELLGHLVAVGIGFEIFSRAAVALAASSAVFGLAHMIPQRQLVLFTLWAMWEGMLLGSAYILSGSLLIVVILHVLHDIIGFNVFAVQRRMWARAATSPSA